MPTFIKTGHHPGNKGKITCKGFFIKRVKNTVTRRWGSIVMGGHSYKKINWEIGYPQTKVDTFKTIDEAAEFMRVLILRRFSNGYEKIDITIK